MADIKTGYLRSDQVKALSILARMRVEELRLSGENPTIIEIYESSLEQLVRFK